MKKTHSAKRLPKGEEDMLAEYQFDYRKARRNRFAPRMKHGSRAVLLDPDVAEVFATPQAVNKVLRALIESMPDRNSR